MLGTEAAVTVETGKVPETIGEAGMAIAIENAPDPKGERIRNLYHEIVGFARKTLDHIVEIGQLLDEKKAELPHGEYRPWVQANCPFGIDAAENYHRIYQRQNEIPMDKITTLSQALKFLKKTHALVAPSDPTVKHSAKNPDEQRLEVEAAAREKAQLLENIGITEQATESEPLGIKPIESGIKTPERKEEGERAKLVKETDKRVSDFQASWSESEYSQLLMDLDDMIARKKKAVEERSKTRF